MPSTLLTAPVVRDPRRLAERLAALELPGRRSMTAITKLRRTRERQRPVPARSRTLRERADARLIARYSAEIARRGGETVIEEGAKASALREKPLQIAERCDGMVVLHVTGWRFYSRGHGSRQASLSYLCGTDDAGLWAVRVPGTITTVSEALAWLTPGDVVKALDKGLRVRRQGDVYAIETTAKRDGDGSWDLPEAHEWRAGTRYLVHTPADGRKHRPLRLPYPVRFVPQRAYEMGRSGARTNAD